MNLNKLLKMEPPLNWSALLLLAILFGWAAWVRSVLVAVYEVPWFLYLFMDAWVVVLPFIFRQRQKKEIK